MGYGQTCIVTWLLTNLGANVCRCADTGNTSWA